MKIFIPKYNTLCIKKLEYMTNYFYDINKKKISLIVQTLLF